MNSRPLIVLSIIIIAICGVAIWFLQTTPPAPPLPEIIKATPQPTVDLPATPSALPSLTKATPPPASTPVVAPPKAGLADWEVKIDSILRANPDNSDAANSATAQMLINVLPTLPPDGQTEAAQHISNLLSDKDYSKVLPIIKNPTMPEDVLDVFVTDLMNRDDTVKLPTLLEIAKIPNHPHHEEAATDLEIFLDGDYGTDWAKWEAEMRKYLKKQAAENAEAEGTAPPAPTLGK
jgi:hypothetical protein